MFISRHLRSIKEADHLAIREVYEDAIRSQGSVFYTKKQIEAWSSLAWMPGVLDKPLYEGKGWLICSEQGVEAFAVRYPLDRLALLYCRGRSVRQGNATFLLDRLEKEARQERQTRLVTEASFFSYPLLLQGGWKLLQSEQIAIGGIIFERFRMEKSLLKAF